ncbi:uncharacterized protein LOC119299902 [Triticum dicoccoides]|uniref:uncharacterized protein LOC119299902 n=1 Tax=Triticum dicoccoides TaxID=85692 RepID=UPI00188FA765|nr:uncharacterized protein LOC119299902 [Triticum dicoccoides]
MHPLVGALLVGAGERWWWPCWGPAARHAAAWAGALALAVSVASFAPEAAFLWALASGGCAAGSVRVPLDGGGDHVCVPARMAGRTCADIIVPPVFAALSVGASACFVRTIAIGRRHGY